MGNQRTKHAMLQLILGQVVVHQELFGYLGQHEDFGEPQEEVGLVTMQLASVQSAYESARGA